MPTDHAALPIPDELIHAANRTRELWGRAKPEALRVPFVFNGTVVGFYTPHETTFGMRLGPIYVAPGFRRLGLARAACENYRDRVCVAFVANGNTASEALHKACGFTPWRRGMKGWFWRRLPAAAP